MLTHFKTIKEQDGFASIHLPNSIFRDLSKSIRNKGGSSNVKQVSFAYSYLIAVGFLYKYSMYVDIDNQTYVQNGDLKEMLGYTRLTKTIDRVIKKDGVLDSLGLTSTTKNFPVSFEINKDEKINKIPIREFTYIEDLSDGDVRLDNIKGIVKNRNYEVKDPLYLTRSHQDFEYGTLYSMERTHVITIGEFIKLIEEESFNNIDILLYGFFKYKCKGRSNDMNSIAVYKITSELGMDFGTLSNHINILKKRRVIRVSHKRWRPKEEDFVKMESNDYYWLGV